MAAVCACVGCKNGVAGTGEGGLGERADTACHGGGPRVDQPGMAVPATLYGIFFEEINCAGDGGL